MPTFASSQVVVGIDVGSGNKGFHAVALYNGGYHARTKTKHVNELARWVLGLQATVVAVDAPCRWSITGRSRPAERALHNAGIHCFFTPTCDAALAHPKNNYGWMFNGEAAFGELKKTHPLCTNLPSAGQVCCFETYPHAIAWHLRGGNADASHKRKQRRALLEQAGIDLTELTNIDLIDAALCALTAYHAAKGEECVSYGEPDTGLIIVPASPLLEVVNPIMDRAESHRASTSGSTPRWRS